jgi:hypothetical protein
VNRGEGGSDPVLPQSASRNTHVHTFSPLAESENKQKEGGGGGALDNVTRAPHFLKEKKPHYLLAETQTSLADRVGVEKTTLPWLFTVCFSLNVISIVQYTHTHSPFLRTAPLAVQRYAASEE